MDYEDLYDVSRMQPRDRMRYTTCNMIYRISHNKVDPSHCGLCLHGSGCNRPGKNHYRNNKNWKQHRKAQFK